MNYKILAIFLIILLSGGYANAYTFDVNATGNNTQVTTSSTWTALRGTPHNNLTITTGTEAPNQTIIISSFDSMVNYTTSLFQARLIMDDTQTLNTYNITQLANVKASNSFVTNVLNISGGTHNFSLQAWSTAGRQATIYRWNMTIQHITRGTYVDTSNTTYLKNTSILNTSTVTVTKNANGTVELTSSASSGGFTFQNVSGSRVEETIYRNTNTTARMVTICLAGVAVHSFLNDASTPPTTVTMKLFANNNVYACGTSIVLPNNYYKLNSDGAGANIMSWGEWN